MKRSTSAALLAATAACSPAPQAQISSRPPDSTNVGTTEPTSNDTPTRLGVARPEPERTEPNTPVTVTVTLPAEAPEPTVLEPFYVWPEEDETIGEPVTASQLRDDLLACIRSYEQGADGYATDTGNGYYGAYQFDYATWQSVGGTGNPAHASPAEQDERAWALYLRRGLAPWPTPARRCA